MTMRNGMIEALRQRKTDLELSCLLIDELSGLPTGYTGKMLDRNTPSLWAHFRAQQFAERLA
jgi:hypothetical protein